MPPLYYRKMCSLSTGRHMESAGEGSVRGARRPPGESTRRRGSRRRSGEAVPTLGMPRAVPTVGDADGWYGVGRRTAAVRGR